MANVLKYKSVLLTYTLFSVFALNESRNVAELIVIPPVESVKKLLVYDDIYPIFPRPITVDVSWLVK